MRWLVRIHSKDGRFVDKDLLVRWSPDATASLASKLLYSGSEGAIKGKFGRDKVLQCTDASDVTLAHFITAAGNQRHPTLCSAARCCLTPPSHAYDQATNSTK